MRYVPSLCWLLELYLVLRTISITRGDKEPRLRHCHISLLHTCAMCVFCLLQWLEGEVDVPAFMLAGSAPLPTCYAVSLHRNWRSESGPVWHSLPGVSLGHGNAASLVDSDSFQEGDPQKPVGCLPSKLAPVNQAGWSDYALEHSVLDEESAFPDPAIVISAIFRSWSKSLLPNSPRADRMQAPTLAEA